jgi:hypothetical protein
LVIDRIPQEIKEKVKEIIIIDNDSKDNTYLVGVGYKQQTGLSNLEIINAPEQIPSLLDAIKKREGRYGFWVKNAGASSQGWNAIV